MNWLEQVNPTSNTWHGVEAYAIERIAGLSLVCCSIQATDQEIRAAQAGIAELQRLISLPQQIAAAVQQKQQPDRRKGY